MRRRWLVVGVVAPITALAGAVAYDAWTGRQTGDVAMPPDDASPVEVVTAYLDALDAHDCDTAIALWEVDARSTPADWCEDVDSVRGRGIRYSAESRLTAEVAPAFHLTWRPFHADGSMPEGLSVWGFRLARDSKADPWRIVDHGQG